MHTVLGVALIAHGFAHLVGFLVPWKLAKFPEAPFKTTVVGGRFDIGEAGVRVVGSLWLIAALAFAVGGVGVLLTAAWWAPVVLISALFSLVLGVLGLPESRFGIVVDLVILGYLLVASRSGLLSG